MLPATLFVASIAVATLAWVIAIPFLGGLAMVLFLLSLVAFAAVTLLSMRSGIRAGNARR